MTITVNPIADFTNIQSAADSTVDLLNNFDDPKTTGLVAQFTLAATLNDPFLAGSVTNVLLFDQAGGGAPGTVQNFQNYVDDGDYVNTFIHRSNQNFVIQGGGFNFQDTVGFDVVPTDAAIQNEFSSDRSNLRGTIAMAKLSNNPDSATSQWFFNLANNNDPNNPDSLDNQNGGFTVFGQVLSQNDLDIIDAIANVQVFNGSSIASVFGNLPLISDDNSFDGEDELVRYSNISIIQRNELTFGVVSNSNSSVVSASISTNGQLILDYQQPGIAEIVIRATNLLGETTEDTFTVTVTPDPVTPDPVDPEPVDPEPEPVEPPIDMVPGDDSGDDGVSDDGTDSDGNSDGGNDGATNDESAGGDDTVNPPSPGDTPAMDAPADPLPITPLVPDSSPVLTGSDLANTVFGNADNNIIDGRDGNDRLLGLDGDDQLIGGGGSDRLIGGNGNDDLDGGSGKDKLNGGAGNDTLMGGGGNDTLNGGNDNDILSGDGGNDKLKGGKGNDILDGGKGSDRLFGGSGKDIFVLQTGKGRDQVRDFTNGQDKFRAIGVSFNDITLTQLGKNTVITVDGDDIAFVRKTDITDITKADFVR
ncbi:MAG: peptidylprolyl isomerase [Leptolyngbyaceae bacterium]|nr:peptidylprolyl isomerase [Leptolyngbyaceae bacterium]